MAAKSRKRGKGGKRRAGKSHKVRLKGLGGSLSDTADTLADIADIASSPADKKQLRDVVKQLEKTKEDVQALCRSWSRSFDVDQ